MGAEPMQSTTAGPLTSRLQPAIAVPPGGAGRSSCTPPTSLTCHLLRPAPLRRGLGRTVSPAPPPRPTVPHGPVCMVPVQRLCRHCLVALAHHHVQDDAARMVRDSTSIAHITLCCHAPLVLTTTQYPCCLALSDRFTHRYARMQLGLGPEAAPQDKHVVRMSPQYWDVATASDSPWASSRCSCDAWHLLLPDRYLCAGPAQRRRRCSCQSGTTLARVGLLLPEWDRA